MVGGGEDGGSEWEGMTARAVSKGDEGGDMGSSTDRDSKGLEDEGKGGIRGSVCYEGVDVSCG